MVTRVILLVATCALACTVKVNEGVTCGENAECSTKTPGTECNLVTGLCQPIDPGPTRESAIKGTFDCPVQMVGTKLQDVGRFQAKANRPGPAQSEADRNYSGTCTVTEIVSAGASDSLFEMLLTNKVGGAVQGSGVLLARGSLLKNAGANADVTLEAPDQISGAMYNLDATPHPPTVNPNRLAYFLWGGSVTARKIMDAQGSPRFHGTFDLDLLGPPAAGSGKFGGQCQLSHSCGNTPVDRCFHEELIAPECGAQDCLPINDGTRNGFCNSQCESRLDCVAFDATSVCVASAGSPVGLCQHQCMSDTDCGSAVFKCNPGPAPGTPGTCAFQGSRMLPGEPDGGILPRPDGGILPRPDGGRRDGAVQPDAAAPCDVLDQTTCPGGQGCYGIAGMPTCRPAGTTALGSPCTMNDQCVPGSSCNGMPMLCRQVCRSGGGAPMCPAGQTCVGNQMGAGSCR